MANTIKHKRGSGSNPSANDLVAGEIAIRTDTGVLFTKKDDNSVVSISGGSTNLGVSTTSSAVTVTSSSGNNATISEASSSAAGVMSTAHHDKLDGIEANATADQSASEILTAIKTVDGSGSGLDADLVDGIQAGSFLRSDANDSASGTVDFLGGTSTTPAVRVKSGGNSWSEGIAIHPSANNGYALAFFRTTASLSTNTNTWAIGNSGASGINSFTLLRNGLTGSAAQRADAVFDVTQAGTFRFGFTPTVGSNTIWHAGNDGASSGLDADLLDGQHGSHYLDYNNFSNTPTIPTNNNQLTNGAGYITATLTNEQVQDIVGGMVTGNTESGITVTYQDADGTLDFSVASQTDNNFTTALKNKLDGIAAGATNVTNNNQLTNGAGYITATLTNEQVQDIVGGMLSGNTESGITVTYQDADGTIDFSVASQTDNNFTTTLKNKLDGIAAGAQVNVGTNLGTSRSSTGVTITSSTGNNTSISEATSSDAGVMTSAMHDKLDGIAAGATNVTNTNQLTNGAGYITSADGGNAATLDGIDSSQFLRSDAADTKTSGNLTFNDNIKLQLGSSSDLQIYHNGSNSFIDDAGTGGLYLRSNQTQISKYTGETCAKFSADGSVELYYDNSLKLNTTSSGIDVSGIVDIDSHVRHNGDGNTYFGFNGNDQINFYTNGNERFKIDSNGHMYFGQSATSIPGLGNTTTGASFEKLSSGGAFFSSRADGPGLFVNRNNNGDVIQFYRSGNGKGSIAVNNNGSNFNNGSDYRLKENIVDLTGAISRLKQLQPKCFNFIDDPDATQVDGFIAHEASTVLPWAVTGTHNQVELWGDYETDELPEGVSVGDPKLDDDGNTIPVMQGMDYGKLTPLLTAALQEAIAKIETLETQNADLLARVTALEGS